MSKKIPLDKSQPPIPEKTVQKGPSSHRGLSKILYQMLFNAVNDAIFLVDAHTGTLLEVNDKFCQMTGFSREETKSLSIAALFNGESPYGAAEATKYMQKALQEGPQLFEWQARDRSGRRHWVELNLTAAPIGRKRYLIAVGRDIQARKEAEQKEKQSEVAIMASVGRPPGCGFAPGPGGRYHGGQRHGCQTSQAVCPRTHRCKCL